MDKKQLFNTFSNVGLVQILPAFVAIASLIGLVVVVVILAFQPIYGRRNPSETYIPSNEDLFYLTIFCLASLFFLSGLITFILSSAHFIRAKRAEDYQKLVAGMKYLNWGWSILGLFTAIMISLLFIW